MVESRGLGSLLTSAPASTYRYAGRRLAPLGCAAHYGVFKVPHGEGQAIRHAVAHARPQQGGIVGTDPKIARTRLSWCTSYAARVVRLGAYRCRYRAVPLASWPTRISGTCDLDPFASNRIGLASWNRSGSRSACQVRLTLPVCDSHSGRLDRTRTMVAR